MFQVIPKLVMGGIAILSLAGILVSLDSGNTNNVAVMATALGISVLVQIVLFYVVPSN